MKATTRIIKTALSAVVFLSAPLAHAASKTSNWVPETGNGTFLWEESANWTNGIPNNGADAYTVGMNHTTGNLLLDTGTAPVTISALNITQTADGGALTLRLNSNFKVLTSPVFTNQGSSTANLKIDLNGYTFDANTTNATALANLTLNSTIAGGVYKVWRLVSSTNVTVGSGVTIQATTSNTSNARGYQFAEGSTLWFTSASSSINNAPTDFVDGIKNLVVGDSASASKTNLTISASTLYVENITLHRSTTAGSDSVLTLSAATGSLRISGFVKDEGSSSSDVQSFGAAKPIYFLGGSAEKEIEIHRTGLINPLFLGDGASTVGNIKLNADLATTGSATIYGGSRLNAGTMTLKAGDITLENNALTPATLAITVGADTGLVEALGLLSLNRFQLELFPGSGWVDGGNLALFKYDTLSGTPELTGITAPPGFTYDALWNDTVHHTIYLTNVAIPEPSTAILFSVGGVAAFLVGRRRR